MPVEHTATERRPVVKRSQRPLIIAIIALFILAAIGLILAHLFSGKKVIEATPPPALKGAPVVTTNREPPPLAPAIVQTPKPKPDEPQPAAQPPADVVRYLEHLKRVEAYRQGMRDDVNPALQMLKSAYSVQLGLGDEDDQSAQRDLQQGYSKYIRNWQNLIRYFQALPPPQPCAELANTYGQALASYVQVMSTIQVAMSNGDISALLSLRGSSQMNVDRQLRASDRQLQQICDRYGIEKQFDIQTDSDVGTLLGF
ncbi:MAG: hypothetical protein IT209_12215 [Armatimonadetes bacterium]|nr:hypothetical protein [Armatimonadota bacterium]